MFVNRRKFQARVGCREELIRISLDEVHRTNAQGNFQVNRFGGLDNFTLEIEFESMAAYDKFWEDWSKSEAAAKFFEQSNPLSMPGGVNEFWEIKSSNLPGPLEMPRYIDRTTVPVKVGCWEDALNLLNTAHGKFGLPYRVMMAVFGTMDQICIDFGYNTVEEKDRAWEQWGESQEGQAFFAQWNQLIEPGTSVEQMEIFK